jgi:hypothetical protein
MDLTYSYEAIPMSSHNGQISLFRIWGMYCLTLMRHGWGGGGSCGEVFADVFAWHDALVDANGGFGVHLN